MKFTLLSTLTLSLAFCVSAHAAKTTPLLDAGTSWNGAAFHYPEGTPKVTAVKIQLKHGESTPIHCHPVPLFAYIVKGQLRVTTRRGEARGVACFQARRGAGGGHGHLASGQGAQGPG